MEGLVIEVFREQALRELAEIDRALEAAAEGNATVMLDQTAVGRLSRMDAVLQQAMSGGLVERLRMHRRRLVAAIERMANGEYGLCCKCQDELSLERLKADIAAPFCVDCQEAIDERGKDPAQAGRARH